MAERLTDAGGMTLRMVSEKMKKAIKEGGKIVLKNAEHLQQTRL